MRTRLQSNVNSRSLHIMPISRRIFNRLNLGMIRAYLLSKAFSQNTAVSHNDTTNGRIGRTNRTSLSGKR